MSFEVEFPGGQPQSVATDPVGDTENIIVDASGSIAADQTFTTTVAPTVNSWWAFAALMLLLDANASSNPPVVRSIIRFNTNGINFGRDLGTANDRDMLVGGTGSGGVNASLTVRQLLTMRFPPTAEVEFVYEGNGAAADNVEFETRALIVGR